jgi:hypothetical protein
VAAAAQEAPRSGGHRPDGEVVGGEQGAPVHGDDVHRLVAQRLHQQLHRAAGDLELHPRVVARHVGQEGLHQHRGRGRAEADAERAELPLLEQLDAPFQLPRLEEDALGPLRHQLTVGRQRGALAVPVDQPHVQILLEGLDAAAQRRLGEEEGLGGLAEGVVLGQGDEVAQLVEVLYYLW